VPHGIGDATLLTPLPRLLRTRFPEVAIHLIVFNRATRAFFAADAHVTAVHCLRDGLVPTATHLLRRRFDVVYNPKDHASRTFLLYGALLRAGYRIGHDAPSPRGLFDFMPQVDDHAPMAVKHAAVMGAFGQSVWPGECRPSVPAMPVSPEISRWLSEPQPTPLVGLNLSTGRPDRQWTDDAWAAIIGTCPDLRFVIFAAPSDLRRKQTMEAAAPNVVPTPATKNLYEVSLLVDRLRVLVSPDTSLVHVASSTGTPVIGLYTNARHNQTRYGPFLVPHEIVASTTPAVGDIAVADVVAALRRVLAL
jgi:heptosyltransferase III